MSLKKTILLGLNELNLDFIRFYINEGKLPNFKRLLDNHGYVETTSEEEYELLEPWIQWVTVHTGLSYHEHKVFRLGDITGRNDLKQIWEIAEQEGLSVGAVSPFNAANRLQQPAFFVPDPWTNTKPTGHPYLIKLSKAVSQAVNDNADKKLTLTSILSILNAIRKVIPIKRYKNYLKALKNIKKVGSRALVLDNLLADVFLFEWKKSRPDFASLFLNTGAHFQHHYMFNSGAYNGNQKNPEWYCPSDQDPLLNILIEYDQIIEEILKFENTRLLIATGLHQNPHEHLTYYWRLKNHTEFLDALGLNFHTEVLPRMSRDFLINFKDESDASRGEELLNSCKPSHDNQKIFNVDNRGNSLFVELIYSNDIPKDFTVISGNRIINNFQEYVAFVAIKNGEHNGIGYYINTEWSEKRGKIELKSIFHDLQSLLLNSKPLTQ